LFVVGDDDDRGLVGTRASVVCLGHAVVDRLAHVSVETIGALGIEENSMTLVDGQTLAKIAEAVGEWTQVAGGSSANTAVGLACFGDDPVFVGSVGCDELGSYFESDLGHAGVRCSLSHAPEGMRTGQCLVLVAPDSDRSMATNLGAGVVIDTAPVAQAGIASAAAVYLEGYLLDSPLTHAGFERAVELAKGAGVPVALSLSDPFVVERHAQVLAELVRGDVDVLFANEAEAMRFTGASDLPGALLGLQRPGLTAVVTLGPDGAVLMRDGRQVTVEGWSLGPVVDTTGAGDLFAAGVLHGITHQGSLEQAGRLGALAAAEVISHLGARPEVSLKTLARQKGLDAGLKRG
jgi:sugar/nucleoside kinase (ribokinase family)